MAELCPEVKTSAEEDCEELDIGIKSIAQRSLDGDFPDVPPTHLAAETDMAQSAEDMTPPVMMEVHTINGISYSVTVTPTLTIWDVKSMLKRLLRIPKREMNLLVGTEILASPDEVLCDAVGVIDGTVHITLIRSPATCAHCGAESEKRCGGCSAYYCGVGCQLADWLSHRPHCKTYPTPKKS